MNYLIRPARIEDAEAMFVAHKRSIYEICSRDYSGEQIKSWMPNSRSAQDYMDRILNPDKKYLVVETQNNIAGFAAYKNNEITAFYFHPDFTSKGLATKLFYEVEETIRQSGYLSIELEGTITALPFYQKMGMTVIEETKHRFQNGVTVPVYLMSKIF